MSTQGKILASIGVIFFVCLVVWVVRTTPKEPPPIEKVEPPTVVEYEGNTLTEEKDGKIIWELTCDKMRVDSITQDMELTNVKGKYYDDETTWELTAVKGVYDQTEQIIYVEDDVVLTTSLRRIDLVFGKGDAHGERQRRLDKRRRLGTYRRGAYLVCRKGNSYGDGQCQS